MLILLVLWLSITTHLQESRAVVAEFGAGSQEPGSSSECRAGLEGKAGGEGGKTSPVHGAFVEGALGGRDTGVTKSLHKKPKPAQPNY